ncbi:MAG: hypothetical protein GY940_24610 [bacterium]|nr:hypothetical protein [bacterium]
MKKTILFVMMILLVLSSVAFGQERDRSNDDYKEITKTYILQHVSPEKVSRTLRRYYLDASFDRSGNMFTVTIRKKQIADFEKMLKQLDVERRKIMLRIFTVVASSEGKSDPINNRDLDQVLKKLQKVLSFKSFRLDGVSALTVKDGQRESSLLLASKSSLRLRMRDIVIRKSGSVNNVEFWFQIDQQPGNARNKDSGRIWDRLISSQTSVKENGYLVAGVSKIGKNGDSLVLVINATVE